MYCNNKNIMSKTHFYNYLIINEKKIFDEFNYNKIKHIKRNINKHIKKIKEMCFCCEQNNEKYDINIIANQICEKMNLDKNKCCIVVELCLS
jgi:hypothetical protein